VKRSDYIVGLDVGTTKICALIAVPGEGGTMDILGVGTHPSRGLRRGVVVNMEQTVESIASATDEAERMANVKVHDVYVGIAGSHIRSFNSHGIVAVKGRQVASDDVSRVLEAARAVNVPQDHEVIHVLPQEYVVDHQNGIRDPHGISAIRLEGKVHIVTGAVTAAQNLVRSVEQAGLEVKDFVLEQLASSLSCLTDDERELGVALVDIGGGTTDIAVFHDAAIRYTSVIPLGGDHVTRDIAIGLRTPTHEAERIKRRSGCVSPAQVDREETLEVPSVGGREPRILSRRILCEIIELRMEEILRVVRQEIQKNGYEDLIASGLVLTGGTTLMAGMTEFAEEILGLPIRLGIPMGMGGGLVQHVRSPVHSTAVGLLLYGQSERLRGRQWRLNGEGNRFPSILSRRWWKPFKRRWFDQAFRYRGGTFLLDIAQRGRQHAL